MVNRRRNLNLHLMFTKEEKELLKTVANLKGITMTEFINECVKKEYEILKEKQLQK